MKKVDGRTGRNKDNARRERHLAKLLKQGIDPRDEFC